MTEMPLSEQFILRTNKFMQGIIHKNDIPNFPKFKNMIDWHLGWSEETNAPQVEGKRLRPLFVLLFANLTGGNWQAALPAAAAVEFIHNFTLVHDDIQDNSPTRHSRDTLWVKYGISQAINTGDSLFGMSEICLKELSVDFSPERILTINQLIDQTVINLTKGQFLDIHFENADSTTLESYLDMINWKTAELISACAQIGTILGSNLPQDIQNARIFGTNLGIAFQIQDDYLGIWGEPDITGKSNQNDLISRKKTLPVIKGLQNKGEFYNLWNTNDISHATIKKLISLLESEGVEDYTKEKALSYYAIANNALSTFSEYDSHIFDILRSLTEKITSRKL